VAPESLVNADWWSDAIDETTAFRNPRFQTLVLGSLACLALALTALGVFGVINHLVVSRMREMGVRMAIGASRPSIVGLVLKRALTPVLVGLGVGLLAVRGISPLAEAQLFRVDTHDPWTLLAAVAVVVLAALLAAWLPARRASEADPAAILRVD
jgi:ABC-type antimicrobial peptide transport system permease subunit